MNRLKAPCAECAHETLQDVIHLVTPMGDPDEIWARRTYRTLQCRACEAVSLMCTWGDEGDDLKWTSYYPSPVSRKPPPWLSRLSIGSGGRGYKLAAELLEEVYASVRGGQYRLAAMGIRAIFEQMMIAKVGDRGTFLKNLDAFHEGGYISTVEYDAVKTILEAGHAAIHRAFRPSDQDLAVMLDVVEGVFGAIAVHNKQATDLEARIPPRRDRPQTKP